MAKKIWLSCFGGYSYFLLELIFNGNSSWFSFILGGICFRFIGKIRLFNLNNIYKCIICGIIITFVEFFTGIVFNLILNWKMWDYSTLPFNILGQICLPFSLIWIVLSFPAIKLDEILTKKIYFHPLSNCDVNENLSTNLNNNVKSRIKISQQKIKDANITWHPLLNRTI